MLPPTRSNSACCRHAANADWSHEPYYCRDILFLSTVQEQLMKNYTLVFAAAIVVATLPATARAQTGAAGDWEITLNTPQGNNVVNLSLTQDGEKLTGELSSPMGSVPIAGTAADGGVALTAHIDIQGNALELGLNGKLEGEALNGTVTFGDFGEFPFTGKRAAPKVASVAATDGAGAAAPAATPATAAAAVPATDANGKWNITLTINGAGEFPVSATFTQTGDKVSGTLSSMAGEVPVTGTMTGKSLKLDFTAETPQGPLPITMTGELSDTGAFTGKASIAGMGEADWTGTRVQ
jgi:uncharacterized protein (DUF2147 family)